MKVSAMTQNPPRAALSAYLINPAAQTITPVTLTRHPDPLQEIYRHLQCRIITSVELTNGATIYVDDEGLLSNPQAFFSVRGVAQPLAGRGLVVGTTADGEDTDAPCTLDELKAEVSYIVPYVADFWARYAAQATPGVRVAELMPFAAMMATIERDAHAMTSAANVTTSKAGEVTHG